MKLMIEYLNSQDFSKESQSGSIIHEVGTLIGTSPCLCHQHGWPIMSLRRSQSRQAGGETLFR